MKILFLLAAGFESGLSQSLRIISLLAYALAVIVVIIAGWQFKNGNPDQAKAALLGAVIIALAATIATALFAAGGLPTVHIK